MGLLPRRSALTVKVRLSSAPSSASASDTETRGPVLSRIVPVARVLLNLASPPAMFESTISNVSWSSSAESAISGTSMTLLPLPARMVSVPLVASKSWPATAVPLTVS